MIEAGDTLQSLLTAARNAQDVVARRLGRLTQERNHALQQLEQLRHYRCDYIERLHQRGLEGYSSSNYLNFTRFLATLEQAIMHQNGVLARLDSRLEAERSEWHARMQRVKACETLISRRLQRTAMLRAKAEQQAMDESAAFCSRQQPPRP